MAAMGAVAWLFAPGRAVEHVDNAQRLEWNNKFDILFVGDSRTHDAVAPSAMSGSLSGLKIGNFGWGGLGWTPNVFDTAQQALAKDGRRVMVIGLSPFGFSRRSLAQNAFLDAHNSSAVDRWALRTMPTLANYVAPWGTGWWFRKFNPELGMNAFTLHDDGWYEAKSPKLEGDRILKGYIDRLRLAPFDPGILKETAEQVAILKTHGIHVLAFTPPASARMREMESSLGKYDEMAVRRALEGAGVSFLEVPGKFETYDGSHLASAEAKRYSAALAAELAAKLNAQRGAPSQ